MNCPYCNYDGIKVIETREVDINSTRRRRECLLCLKRFTTYENVEAIDLLVMKKDGKKEAFDREKLMRGIKNALVNRPVEPEKILKTVEQIEMMLRKRKNNEIPSKDIGDMVLTRLKSLDHVGYLRYASVYQDFDDIGSFEKELRVLKKKNKEG